VASKSVVTVALIWVGEFTIDVRATPFHVTSDDATKFVPVTVSASAEEPTCADDGESAEIVGVAVELLVEEEPDEPPQPFRANIANQTQQIKIALRRCQTRVERRMISFSEKVLTSSLYHSLRLRANYRLL
jgi:hypothetical protein